MGAQLLFPILFSPLTVFLKAQILRNSEKLVVPVSTHLISTSWQIWNLIVLYQSLMTIIRSVNNVC